MTREKIINGIFDLLEKEHINLYHSISKEEFNKHKDDLIKVADSLDQLHFEAELRRLFALFKDAHTNFYVLNNGKYEKIIAINGHSIDEIIENMSKLMTYETQEWLYNNLEVYICSIKYLAMIDVCSMNDNSVIVKTNKHSLIFKERTNSQTIPNKIYEFSKPNDDLLYIKYSQCREEKDYPFSKFVEDIASSGKSLPHLCLLDVRGNFGGDSSIIKPLINLLKEKQIKTYVLMDCGTFSSGRFAVADCKKELNATLLGTATGGAAKSYGYNKNLCFEDYHFSCSIRLWDFSNIFGYSGAIQPDIKIPKSIKAINTGKDNQLEKAIEYICLTNEKNRII